MKRDTELREHFKSQRNQRGRFPLLKYQDQTYCPASTASRCFPLYTGRTGRRPCMYRIFLDSWLLLRPKQYCMRCSAYWCTLVRFWLHKRPISAAQSRATQLHPVAFDIQSRQTFSGKHRGVTSYACRRGGGGAHKREGSKNDQGQHTFCGPRCKVQTEDSKAWDWPRRLDGSFRS